jgi:hypothetical protein
LNGEAELIEVINNELGGWSLIQDKNIEVDADSIFEKLVNFHKLLQKPLFDVYISEYPKNPKQYVLRVISKRKTFLK